MLPIQLAVFYGPLKDFKDWYFIGKCVQLYIIASFPNSCLVMLKK